MTSKRWSPSRRREDIWARWRAHLIAQRTSGQTQAAYCRSQGLDPRYFSVWKGKLANAERSAQKASVAAAAKPPALQLVPLVIKETSSGRDSSTAGAVSIHLRLPNGLSVSLEIPTLQSLPALLTELARTAC